MYAAIGGSPSRARPRFFANQKDDLRTRYPGKKAGVSPVVTKSRTFRTDATRTPARQETCVTTQPNRAAVSRGREDTAHQERKCCSPAGLQGAGVQPTTLTLSLTRGVPRKEKKLSRATGTDAAKCSALVTDRARLHCSVRTSTKVNVKKPVTLKLTPKTKTCRKGKTSKVAISRVGRTAHDRRILQAPEVTPRSTKTVQKRNVRQPTRVKLELKNKTSSTRTERTAEKDGNELCGVERRSPRAAQRTTTHQRTGPDKLHLKTKILWSLVLKNVPNQPFERFFRDKVSLKGDAISKNSAKLNTEVAELLTILRTEDKRFAFNILNTGSYYEGLKVLNPREFDIMLVFENDKIVPFFQVNCPSRGNHVGYAQLKFQDHKKQGRGLWGELLTSDGKYLSPVKIRRKFSRLLERVISRRRGVTLVKQQSSGPAVTIKIDSKIFVDLVISVEVPGWPASANGWGDYASQRTWPLESEVALLKRSPESKYHLVAKPCKRSKCEEDECQTYWRLSFSAAEKYLLRKKGCEKKCYRVVKAIFETHEAKLKPPLCSYYLKTLFLHRRREHRHQMNLGEDVIRFLLDLLKRLNDQSTQTKLPHFFVHRVDLLAGKPRQELRNVAEILRQIVIKLLRDPSGFLHSLPV